MLLSTRTLLLIPLIVLPTWALRVQQQKETQNQKFDPMTFVQILEQKITDPQIIENTRELLADELTKDPDSLKNILSKATSHMSKSVLLQQSGRTEPPPPPPAEPPMDKPLWTMIVDGQGFCYVSTDLTYLSICVKQNSFLYGKGEPNLKPPLLVAPGNDCMALGYKTPLGPDPVYPGAFAYLNDVGAQTGEKLAADPEALGAKIDGYVKKFPECATSSTDPSGFLTTGAYGTVDLDAVGMKIGAEQLADLTWDKGTHDLKLEELDAALSTANMLVQEEKGTKKYYDAYSEANFDKFMDLELHDPYGQVLKTELIKKLIPKTEKMIAPEAIMVKAKTETASEVIR